MERYYAGLTFEDMDQQVNNPEMVGAKMAAADNIATLARKTGASPETLASFGAEALQQMANVVDGRAPIRQGDSAQRVLTFEDLESGVY